MMGRQADEQTGKAFVIEEVTDLDAVWPHMTSLFLEFEGHNQAFEPRDLLPDWNQRLKARLALHDDRLILLASVQGHVAGCIVAVIRRDDGLARGVHGYLSHMFVREAFRRTGVGSALLARAEGWCSQRGAERVELDVFEENRLGMRFWSNAGFYTCSRTMRKSLETTS
jgi:GNAT superfamily N-acetyltransferase